MFIRCTRWEHSYIRGVSSYTDVFTHRDTDRGGGVCWYWLYYYKTYRETTTATGKTTRTHTQKYTTRTGKVIICVIFRSFLKWDQRVRMFQNTNLSWKCWNTNKIWTSYIFSSKLSDNQLLLLISIHGHYTAISLLFHHIALQVMLESCVF